MEHNKNAVPYTHPAIERRAAPDFSIYDAFPIPVEIFTPDGLCIYVNQATMDLNGLPDKDLIVGKYNLRTDPVVIEICGQDAVDRTFRGEAVFFPDFPAPAQDLVDRGLVDEKPFEKAIMDMHLLPVWDSGKFLYTICFATIKSIHKVQPVVSSVLEYLDAHWREPFNRNKLAKIMNLTPNHFSAFFKDSMGITAQAYYKQLKIDKLMEKLSDPNLSISEAFDACGLAYHGRYVQFFKESTGFSPSQYKENCIVQAQSKNSIDT